MVFIPIQTYICCVPIGLFDDIEEAKDAYIEYLKCHKNFDTWFEQLRKDFNDLFDNFTIDNVDDLKNIIFDDDLYEKLDGEQSNIMEEFWEERYIEATNIIKEVSDKYPQHYYDIVELAAHNDWGYDDVFNNHLSNLMFSLVYRSESRFNNFENYVERLAKLHPLF